MRRGPVRRHLIIAVALLTSACATLTRAGADGSQQVVVEQLLFGRNVRGALAVSDSAWKTFLAEIVTPRFPKGFTVWSADGQYRYADGLIEREPGFVIQLTHDKAATVDSSINAIIDEYKKRFHQESVLRLVMPARATFR